MPRRKHNYISKDDLRDAILEMKVERCVTDRFARMLLDIQEHVLLFPRFRGYREEIKQEMRDFNIRRWMERGWKTIDAMKNPFAYITQGCYLNFLVALQTWFRQQARRRQYLKEMHEMMGLPWIDDHCHKSQEREEDSQ